MSAVFWQLVYLLAFVAACSYAGWLGGWPERCGAGIVVAGSILSVIAATSFYPGWKTPEAGIFIVDLLVLAAFANLALYSDRYWPLWATSFQLVAVLIHLATLASQTAVGAQAYSHAQEFWAYPVIAAMVAGTYNPHRAKRKGRAARY